MAQSGDGVDSGGGGDDGGADTCAHFNANLNWESKNENEANGIDEDEPDITAGKLRISRITIQAKI